MFLKGLFGEVLFLCGCSKDAPKATGWNIEGSLLRGSVSEGSMLRGSVSVRGL